MSNKQIVPIVDVYGPTAVDGEISAIIISEETRAGAASIAEVRKEKGFQPLQVYEIAVLGESGVVSGAQMADLKLSSTAIRRELAQPQKL